MSRLRAAIGGNSAVKAGRWEILAYTGGEMVPHGTLPDGPIGRCVLDLSGAQLPGADERTPIIWGHDESCPVGCGESVTVTPAGVVVSGPHIAGAAPNAPDLQKLSDAKYPLRASVDASVIDYERVPEGRVVHVNGRDFAGPICWVKAWSYDGVSVLTWSADGDTVATLAARKGKNMPNVKAASVETSTLKSLFAAYPGKQDAILEMLDQGMDEATIKQAMDAATAAETPAETPVEDKPAEPLPAAAGKKPDLFARAAALTAKHPAEAVAILSAIQAGKSDAEVETDILRTQLAAEKAKTARLEASSGAAPIGRGAATRKPDEAADAAKKWPHLAAAKAAGRVRGKGNHELVPAVAVN